MCVGGWAVMWAQLLPRFPGAGTGRAPQLTGQEGWAGRTQRLGLAHQARLPLGYPVSVGPLLTAGERPVWQGLVSLNCSPCSSVHPSLPCLALAVWALPEVFSRTEMTSPNPEPSVCPPGTQGGVQKESHSSLGTGAGAEPWPGAVGGRGLLQVTPLRSWDGFSVVTQLE